MREASIEQLLDRIRRKRSSRQSIARDLVRLQDARHAQLAAEIEAAQRARAHDRREPGSFQREIEFDE